MFFSKFTKVESPITEISHVILVFSNLKKKNVKSNNLLYLKIKKFEWKEAGRIHMDQFALHSHTMARDKS